MLNRTQVQQALDAGGGLLRLEPSWVPRSFMMPGRRLKLHPDDLYALGGHRGGINERWFSSTTNADNGPGTPADEGLSYVRLADGSALPAEGRRRPGRRPAARRGRHGAREGLEPALQVLRQPGRHPAPHAPERRAGASCSAGRASPRPTTSRRSTTRRSTTSPTPSWASSRAPRRRTSAVPRELEQRRQRHHVPVARLPPRARHRLADRSAHPARPRLARHLRAAGEQRRVRDVPVRGRRPHRALGPPGEGRPARAPPGSRLHRRHARLGRQRQPELRRRQQVLPEAGDRQRRPSDAGYQERWIVLRHRVVFGEGADRAAERKRARSRTAPRTASS